MRRHVVLALFLLFATGGTISLQQRTDDWWLKPHVEVSTEYRPYFIPKQMVTTDECSKRDFYLAPWVREIKAEISAYNSAVGQTDSDPWIAANNRRVFPGGIATNILPCGSEVMIPELFGSQILVVNDRMNRRYHPLHPGREKDNVLNFDVWVMEEGVARRIGRKEGKRVVVVKYEGA